MALAFAEAVAGVRAVASRVPGLPAWARGRHPVPHEGMAVTGLLRRDARDPRSARFAAACAAVLAAALFAGCSPKTALVPRVPPETTLFVQGPVDTVNHLVHLYWYGSDADGYVVAYEVRFLDPSAPADSVWVRTTALDSLFAVSTPTGFSKPVFEVRAIDNDGLRDPEPARQLFNFSNQPATVTIGPYPVASDTTYASLTLSWTALDPDGDGKKLRFRVWLDGNEPNARVVSVTTHTVPTLDFFQGGQLVSGTRTIYVQAIDDGGLAGPVASRSWVVRPTTFGGPARLLIVDDVPSMNTLNFRTDTLFANTAARQLPAGSWSVLRLEFTQPFRSAADAEQTFSLYDAVIWYRGTQTNFPTVLGSVVEGIEAALDGGHSVMIEGLNLVDGPLGRGPLTAGFVARHLDADFMFKNFQSGLADSSVSWGVVGGRVFRSSTLQDSLRISGIYQGLRGFAVRDTNHVLLWARAGILSQPHDFDIPVALSVPQASGARAVLVSLPLVATSASTMDFPQRATVFMNKVLSQLTESRP